jgi:HSP20 family protein
MELRMMNGCTPNGLGYGRWHRVWDELEKNSHALAPRADVIEDAEGYQFYFEMPGLRADSVDVRVEDDALVVEAERNRPEWPKDAQIRVAERAYGKLRRAFELPDDAGHDGIHAAYKDGVLEVRVPKRPESKPFKIKVESQN